METVLTVHQFAQQLGMHPVTVYLAIREGRLPSVKILGRIGIPKAELKKLKKRRNGNKSWVIRAR